VRSWRAAREGKSGDNCPRFADKLVAAWELPFSEVDPAAATPAEVAAAVRELADRPGPAALLWAE
jgi:hypothetical protein